MQICHSNPVIITLGSESSKTIVQYIKTNINTQPRDEPLSVYYVSPVSHTDFLIIISFSKVKYNRDSFLTRFAEKFKSARGDVSKSVGCYHITKVPGHIELLSPMWFY